MINVVPRLLLGCLISIAAIATTSGQESGQITGRIELDNSYAPVIHAAYIDSFDKEFVVSNELFFNKATIDSTGSFSLALDSLPETWSLVRLHVVKKGVTPNSLVIGSNDENFFFLVARKSSQIKLDVPLGLPVFSDRQVVGAPYMKTFDQIKKLVRYPGSIDYSSSLIERQFIEEVVDEKLKTIADSTHNPLVALYALHKTDYRKDAEVDEQFYSNFSSRWNSEQSPYFKEFITDLGYGYETETNANVNWVIAGISLVSLAIIILLSVVSYRRRNRKPGLELLSIQERKIFTYLREGMTNKEIAAACNVETTTVKSHVSSIYSKLEVKSRKEVINLPI
ncbi:MAG: helix-turn-helix transcriptional regulator [Nonlabens sp.]